ncbi:MAG TPA: biopolymer transporter ExbD [Casimicrobiaceae bacterium]|nr:biopolymer transporter ExbD [Casimicrobiaceae bacterium]
MNLRGNRTRDDPEINFIPLIDVMLVILIFLMVTTTYQRVAELQITLPQANADAAKQRPHEINVGLDAQGRYSIQGGPAFLFTTVDAMAGMLKQAAGDAREPVVVINADAQSTQQMVVHIMEAARDAGLVHITFATQSSASARK